MSANLHWHDGDPNQGREANFVAVYEGQSKGKWELVDARDTRECCTICSFYQETRFKLRGVCKDSFFGKQRGQLSYKHLFPLR